MAVSWKLGREAQISINQQLWPMVREVRIEQSSAEADVTCRIDAGWRKTIQALREVTVTITAVYSPDDPVLATLQAAWYQEPPQNVVLLQISDPADNFYTGDFMVSSISNPQPIDDIIVTEIVLKPTRNRTIQNWWPPS